MTTERRPDPDELLARVKEAETRQATRQAQDLLRSRRRGRQDLRDARGGARAAGPGRGRGGGLGRDPRPRRDRGAARRPRDPAPPSGGISRHHARRSSTSTRRWRAGPRSILVDELAHTNAPGSRHAKRWQDVVELLDAGIHVYTAMNVQHVESLNDVVAKITGVIVRETVPDSIFEHADEVELIDLSARRPAPAPAGRQDLHSRAGARGRRELLPQGQPDRAARAGAAA